MCCRKVFADVLLYKNASTPNLTIGGTVCVLSPKTMLNLKAHEVPGSKSLTGWTVVEKTLYYRGRIVSQPCVCVCVCVNQTCTIQ